MAQNSILDGSEDEVDFPPNYYIYRVIDIMFVTFSISTLLLDWGFDIGAAYNHWHHDDYAWFTLTIIFMGSSSLAIMVVSLRWSVCVCVCVYVCVYITESIS
ncbi:hypothetical protein E2C01_076085 [Portunus trituberculatus]|uniref:XK-related protein n=1 Tax=Portunus trituberculatus TaxID=210409 RepID=A0A5B7IL44_PORTR|nr:hypothetical protein [Portunus trituberculatus]